MTDRPTVVEECGLTVRLWGESGTVVFVLHGGPAARGSAAAMARGLAEGFRVVEPWQRGSSDEPLTVARHVEDLHALVQRFGEGKAVPVVGESWGAMLALCYAAEHPASVSRLVLVGCGTFNEQSRGVLQQRIAERTTDAMRERLGQIEKEEPDEARRMKAMYQVIKPIYDVEVEEPPAGTDPQAEAEPMDGVAHRQTWEDMLRVQAEGVYPEAFRRIDCPVLMLHGAEDPHPGQVIYEHLRSFIPQLRYTELDRCGHRPWYEVHAREAFFEALRDELPGV